jgi:hypothetical protein
MNIQQLNQQLNKNAVNFTTTITLIDNNYNFTPTKFINNKLVNAVNTNNGSCKIFAYAKLNNLSKQATLNAFGDFYSLDVLANPSGEDHANIRSFMATGWDGIKFFGEALTQK